MLEVMIFAASITSSQIPVKACLYILKMYQTKYPYFEKLESILPLIQSYFFQVNPLPPTAFSFFPFVIGTMECPEANIDAKLFLDITTKIFKEKIDVLTRQQAERVAGEFSIYVSALEVNAIHLFRYIVSKIDVETTAVRLIPLNTYFSEELGLATYGSAQAHIFAFEVR